MLLFLACAILSLTYGVVKFKGTATTFMLLGWAVAAFQTYLVIEPLQVRCLAHAYRGGKEGRGKEGAAHDDLRFKQGGTASCIPLPTTPPGAGFRRASVRLYVRLYIVYLWLAQVCVIVCMPCLWRDNTRCGRCCLRTKYVYNEIFAP